MAAPPSGAYSSCEEPIPKKGRPRSAARTFIPRQAVKTEVNSFFIP